jgi:hypothetical protein
MQQHAVPEGGQGEPRPTLRLQELRLQTGARFTNFQELFLNSDS